MVDSFLNVERTWPIHNPKTTILYSQASVLKTYAVWSLQAKLTVFWAKTRTLRNLETYNAFQTILRNYKMPIFSIICYIVRNLRNVSEKYKNNLIYADSKEFEVSFWLFSAQFCRKCIRIKHLFLLYGLFPRFLAHFYATFLYFLQTNIGFPKKVIKLILKNLSWQQKKDFILYPNNCILTELNLLSAKYLDICKKC